jgi:hypothetical protein
MGIDGIGKPPPIGPAAPPLGPGGVGGEFKVAPAAAPDATSALSRLERGEIGLDAYLDGKVVEATGHLVGKVSPAQLDFVRQTLRTELASDPVLVALVRRATGKTPETTGE